MFSPHPVEKKNKKKKQTPDTVEYKLATPL